MPKGLFKNIFVLLLANLLIKPLWIFGVDLKVQNILGAEEYGLYFVVFNFSFLFHILLDLGINQFHNRELAQNPSLLESHFGKLFVLKLLFSFAYFVITFLLALSFSYSPEKMQLLFFLALQQVLHSFILFSRSNFTALQWYAWDAFFSVFERCLSILFCLVLLYSNFFVEFKLLYFIYAQSLALALGAIGSVLVVVFKGKLRWPSLNFDGILPLIKLALPFALVVLLMTIYTRIDAVMLDKLLPQSGDEEAGIYAAGYRLLDAVNMIPFLLASLLIPNFARQLKNSEDFKPILWTAFDLFIALCIPFVLFIAFFYQQLLDFLYPSNSPIWNLSFRFLLFSFPAIFLSYIFGGFLTAAGRMNLISFFALLTILLNLTLNLIWIPKYGASGAAVATFISQYLMAFAQMFYVIYHWKLKWQVVKLVKAVIYLLLLSVSLFLILELNSTWILKFLFFTFIAILLSLALRLIDVQKLLKL
ncbi:MAG: oligosaccharide flippase family protein [Chitinophagales bacterium]|nr:oligosaccharide flippase family protein [Chitinophagales bacterium]